MSRHRGVRDTTPDSLSTELKTRFLAIMREANMDNRIGQAVFAKFTKMAPLEGDPIEWLIPGAYAHSMAQKAPTGESKIVILKLLKATGLSVPNFYSRVRKWIEMNALPSTVRDIVSHSERYFQISRTVFDRYDQMFLSVFRDPLDADGELSPLGERAVGWRKKQKNSSGSKSIQPVDVYVFIWDLFIYVRHNATVVRDDLVICYHLLMCVMDLICHNILALKRRDLLNSNCSILPAEKEESEATETDKKFSLLPYLCATFEGIYRDCYSLYINGFLSVLDEFVKNKDLIADPATRLGLLNPENYDNNFDNINAAYEEAVRMESQTDERVFLVAQDLSNPSAGGDPTNTIDVLDVMRERRNTAPVIPRKMESSDFRSPVPIQSPVPGILTSPLTPTSSCSALERREAQESQKYPALQTAVDLVTKLTNLCTGRTNAPSSNLISILTVLFDKDVSGEFVEMAKEFREKFITTYTDSTEQSNFVLPYVRQRFEFSEMWYFKLLEDVLVSEKNRDPIMKERLRRLVESEKIQKCLFAMAVEMVLFSYNCSKMFPWPLDVLGLTPYEFVKIIEPVIRLEGFPRILIKHFSSVEESILEQLVWKSDSPIWNEMSVERVLPVREVSWAHSLEDGPEPPKHLSLSPWPYSPGGIRNRIAIRQLTTPSSGNLLAPSIISSQSSVSSPKTSSQNSVSSSTMGSEVKNEVIDSSSDKPMTPPAPTEPAPSSQAVPAGTNEDPTKPVKSTPLCLFFRKVYNLAGSRLRDMCDKLGFDAEIEKNHRVMQRMFTLLEHTLTENTHLLKDRHLDQILMCCAYVVAKLEAQNGLDRTFHQIMNAYRNQPQAESRVYRSVLIEPAEDEEPVPAVGSSRHGTRSKSLMAANNIVDPESTGVRGDIIKFYNKVFVRAMQNFIAKCSPKKKPGGPGVILSPVPRANSSVIRRQVHPAAAVYVSPLKKDLDIFPPPPPGGRVLTFTFGVSGQPEPTSSSDANAMSPKRTDSHLSPDSSQKKIRRTGTFRALPKMGGSNSPRKTTSAFSSEEGTSSSSMSSPPRPVVSLSSPAALQSTSTPTVSS